MEWKTVLLGLLGLMGLYLVGSFFVTPMKWLGRLLGCLVMGTVLLAVVNLGGSLFGLHIAINAITILTAGLLQVPGVILLVLAKVLLI